MIERILALLSLFLLAAGCTTAEQTRNILTDSGTLPKQALVSDVPFFPQEKYYCGPAATAMDSKITSAAKAARSSSPLWRDCPSPGAESVCRAGKVSCGEAVLQPAKSSRVGQGIRASQKAIKGVVPFLPSAVGNPDVCIGSGFGGRSV